MTVLEASCIQERYAALYDKLPYTSANNMTLPLLVEGHLDLDALKDALEALLARHTLLRGRFFTAGGYLRVAIDDVPPLELSVVRCDPHAAEQRVKELALQSNRKVLSVANPPLIRAICVACNNASWYLILTIHHNVCDGQSAQLFVSELFQTYASRLRGGQCSLPTIVYDHQDYVRAERKRLTELWSDVILQSILAQASCGASSRVQCGEVGRFSQTLPKEAVSAAKVKARQTGVTLTALFVSWFVRAIAATGCEVRLVKQVVNRRTSSGAGLVDNFLDLRLIPVIDGFTCEELDAALAAERLAEGGREPAYAMLKRVAPGLYVHPYGPAAIEFNLFSYQSEQIARSGCLICKRLWQLAPPLPWAQFAYSLNMVPFADGYCILSLLFDTANVPEWQARNVLDALLRETLSVAGPQ